MRRSTLSLAVATVLGGTAVLRQRREAVKVRRGQLRRLGPAGQPADLPTGGLHGLVAAWRPPPPATRVGRVVATTWSLPLTAVGLLGSALGGVVPRIDDVRDCLVARDVVGLPAAFLTAQGASAATLGRVVVCLSAAPSPGLLDHEAVHVRQQERLGPLFALAYPAASAIWGYRANPFEVAARDGAGER